MNAKSYIYEWNRTIGNRFRISLMAQDNELMQDVEISVRGSQSSDEVGKNSLNRINSIELFNSKQIRHVIRNDLSNED